MSTSISVVSEFRVQQTEFPMSVAVCAWCKPKPGYSSSMGVISHGICPRHLRKMRAQLEKKFKPGR